MHIRTQQNRNFSEVFRSLSPSNLYRRLLVSNVLFWIKCAILHFGRLQLSTSSHMKEMFGIGHPKGRQYLVGSFQVSNIAFIRDRDRISGANVWLYHIRITMLFLKIVCCQQICLRIELDAPKFGCLEQADRLMLLFWSHLGDFQSNKLRSCFSVGLAAMSSMLLVFASILIHLFRMSHTGSHLVL